MTDPYAAYHQPPTHTPGSPPRRRALVIGVAVAAGVVLLAIAIVVPAWIGTKVRGDLERAFAEANLDEVVVFTDLPRDHVDGRVDYAHEPPAGGPHYRAWLDCGVYDVPVPNEPTVHSLEHGTVWITYDPSLAADDVADLERLLPDDGILSPYAGQPAPVVVTVWERQLLLDGADDPRLPLFIEQYQDGHTSPEPMASCRGGLSLEEAEALFAGESV
ncbi:DUF3105 domain-containing protein [Nocardioides sp.]|uniref:DUF3105 domain-containing protein n=1 Tax=Nocardioides sp. TaxID=35761 RepID=UPI00273368AF|nr:DUF3105 domain-containing protein [Nocardioides sp.]MDP3894595.1 DUF3105 domain-containing protein [Nocardioides sp.]